VVVAVMTTIDDALDPRRLKSRWVTPTELDPHPGSEAFAAVEPATDPGATARVILETIRERALLAVPDEEAQLNALADRVEALIGTIAGAPKLDDDGRPVDLYTHAAHCNDASVKANLPSHPTSEDDIELVAELLNAIGDFEDVVAVLLRYGFPR
jgi:hypothetical protein